MDAALQNLVSLSEEEFTRVFQRATEERLARQAPAVPHDSPLPNRNAKPAKEVEQVLCPSPEPSSRTETPETSVDDLPGSSADPSFGTDDTDWLTDSDFESGEDACEEGNTDSDACCEPDVSEVSSAGASEPDPGDSGHDELDLEMVIESSTNGSLSEDSLTGSDVEVAPQLPSAEKFTYHHEPLGVTRTASLVQDLNQEVSYHGRCSLQDAINLQIFGENGLARCIEQPGSWIVISPEQSGKTVGKAVLIRISALLGYPTVVLIKDVKGNANKVAQDLEALLEPFGIRVMYVSGKKIWESAAPLMSDTFSACKVVLVMSAYNTELRCLNDFLEDYCIAGVTVIADESDNIWSSEICDPDASEHELKSQREREMYHLLGSATNPAKRQNPLADGSRVRSLIQVSATHIATIVWHCQWRLPFRFVTADKSMLDQRGYSLQRDLKLVDILEPDDIKASNDYGMKSKQVVQEFQKFATDDRSGRLMMVCLSPFVKKAEAMTIFDIARCILELHVPDAVCIVIHGNGVNALYKKSPSGSSSRPRRRPDLDPDLDPSRRFGVPIFVDDDLPNRADQGSSRRRRHHHDDKQRKRSKQARDAIEMFDREFGEVTPLIIVGYNMIGRCTSIRSRNRVITHIIGAYQQGRSKADAEQMLMRGNGKSREVRARHGFEHIRMVTTKASWWIVRDLYSFTEEALSKSGTGRLEDLMNWFNAEYSEKYTRLFQDKRPWYRKTMGLLDTRGFRNSRTGEPFLKTDLPLQKRTKQQPLREKKRRKAQMGPDTTSYRLMKSIWAVAETAEGHHFKKAVLDAWIGEHPEVLTTEEYRDRQHHGAWSVISKARHWIKKVDRRDGTHMVTDIGAAWCRENLIGGPGPASAAGPAPALATATDPTPTAAPDPAPAAAPAPATAPASAHAPSPAPA
ncbi:hypothetical protein WJX74_000377 [Apatococcus lobatus]|uniref:Uncharacterized protein n=1 Tax=Apatococcus lobatus TaxID=904363 RepID=A0AAW1S5A9_9CHLO